MPLHLVGEDDEDEETTVYLGREASAPSDPPGSSGDLRSEAAVRGRSSSAPAGMLAQRLSAPAVVHTGRYAPGSPPGVSSALASASTWAAIEPPALPPARAPDPAVERRQRVTFLAILAGLLVTAWLMTFCSHQLFSGRGRATRLTGAGLPGTRGEGGAMGTTRASAALRSLNAADALRNGKPDNAERTARARAERESVSFLVRSRPAGATVELDDEPVPGVTPLRLRLPVGEAALLRVSLRNHVSWERTVTPGGASRREVTAHLAPRTGWAQVRSIPSGAEVLMDGVPVGRTPVELGDLLLSEDQTLTLRREGYQDLEARIEWQGRERVDLLLEMARRSPQPARVARRAAPRRRRRRSPSRRRDRAVPARPARRGAPAATRPAAPPAAEPAPAGAGWGTLTVHAVPFGRVVLNGLDIGKETPLNRSPVRAGTHKVRVFFPALGRYSEPRTVRIQPNQESRLFFRGG